MYDTHDPAYGPSRLSFLRERYATAAALGAAWAIPGLRSWGELPGEAPYTMTAARQADCDAFTTRVADAYHEITTAAIRANDPNHMVLGYRYYGATSHGW